MFQPRWDALDPNDPESALIVPREDLRRLQDEVRDQDRRIVGLLGELHAAKSGNAHPKGQA
jgi:hypothetical protein